MTGLSRPARFLACRVGRHRYHLVNDDNPENRQSTHLHCLHCGKDKDITSYDPHTASPGTIGPWM